MAVIDAAPFVGFLLVGAAAGRFGPWSAAWLLALFPPVAHFGLSVLTGRAGDDLLSYVLLVNLPLLGLAVLGLLGGQRLRRRTRPLSDSAQRASELAVENGRVATAVPRSAVVVAFSTTHRNLLARVASSRNGGCSGEGSGQ